MVGDRPIVVAGAGSVGCYVGGALASAGRNIALLARPRVIVEIKRFGLTLTSLEGSSWQVSSQQIEVSDDPEILAEAGVVLVTVKSADTAAIAAAIARLAPRDAVIISLQNGIANVPLLRQRLPGWTVLAAMVPFNVIAAGEGRFHRTTSGDIVVERDEAATAAQLSVPALPIRTTGDIVGVQWGKLLVNLNNAINALSGLTLQAQLAQRRWRMLLADQIAEGLSAIKAEGIAPVSPTPLPSNWTPHLLRLPDTLFGLVLASAMKVDPEARSSMFDDLRSGRRTEIDFLQGVIIEIAERRGLKVPLTRHIATLIRDAEAAGRGSPRLTVEQVRLAIA